MEGKAKLSLGEGGKPFAEDPPPHLIPPVLADDAHTVEQGQILAADGKGGVDADGLFPFVKIGLLDLVAAADGADGVQDRGLPCIILSHQDQGPVNVPDLHVPDGLEIVDVKISQLHAPPSL